MPDGDRSRTTVRARAAPHRPTRAQSQLLSWTLFGSALLLSSYIAGSTRFKARARRACKLGRVSGFKSPLSAIESFSICNSARDDRNTRLRGRFSHSLWQRRTLRTSDSAHLRLVLSAPIRFGATTKIGRTTWNSAIAIDCAPHSPTPTRHPDCRKQEPSVETENGNAIGWVRSTWKHRSTKKVRYKIIRGKCL